MNPPLIPQAGRSAGAGGSPQLPSPARPAGRERVWYPLHRCPECGSYTRIIRRPTGEVYLAFSDRIECGYQETLE